MKVPANAFVNAQGAKVKGAVDLQLREVLKPVDFVMGNMVTVYKGKALESGGSFCLEAQAGGEALALADGKLIDMAIPTRGAKSGMKVFPGKVEGDNVEWLQPRDLMMPVAEAKDVMVDMPMWSSESWVEALGKRTNVRYWVEGYKDASKAPEKVHQAVGELCWKGTGLQLEQDSVVRIEEKTVHLVVSDTLANRALFPRYVPAWDDAFQVAAAVPSGSGKNSAPATKPAVGSNQFKVDPAANYIFQVKELGWANIDRLMYDKSAKPVDIVTRVDNKDVGEVYISMVVKSRSMYLPGYEMKNGTYSFSHGDFEKMQLPIGAKATILATAYADGKPYVSIQDIVIAEKLNVDLHLEPTTKEGLRSTLEARL